MLTAKRSLARNSISDGSQFGIMSCNRQSTQERACFAAGSLHAHVGKVFHLDEIIEAHRRMEKNKAGGKIVVLT